MQKASAPSVVAQAKRMPLQIQQHQKNRPKKIPASGAPQAPPPIETPRSKRNQQRSASQSKEFSTDDSHRYKFPVCIRRRECRCSEL
jgi:hypothetical protein